MTPDEEPVYRRVTYCPVITTLSGGYSSFHYTENGLLGDRVTGETCTHFIKTTTEVFKK